MSEYHVFVHHQAEKYSAAVLEMPDCIGTGATREEAIAQAQAALETRLTQGEIITIQLNPVQKVQPNPWIEEFGRFRADPTWDELQVEITQYRNQLDQDGVK